MGQVSIGNNPFQPGAGTSPPVLAGRDAELEFVERLLGALEQGRRPSQGLLFFGPRGNGKTSLLDRVASTAESRGLRAEELAVSAFDSRASLIRRLQEKAGLTGTRFQDVSVAGVGVAVAPGSPSEDATDLLTRWIGSSASPLAILLDEAQTVPTETGRLFFNAVQSAARRQLPFALFAAGTPDAPRRLREAGTFTERMFQQVPVGRLERDATIRALRTPASDAGRPFSEDAVRCLAAESQDYPYFIQLLGSAAWDAADDAEVDGITRASARNGIANARPHIERFYSQRFQEARSQGVHGALAPLAALVSRHGGRLDNVQLDRFLAEAAGEAGEAEVLHTLTDLGVLWETSPAGWEMGIPSFAEFLLAHHGSETRA